MALSLCCDSVSPRGSQASGHDSEETGLSEWTLLPEEQLWVPTWEKGRVFVTVFLKLELKSGHTVKPTAPTVPLLGSPKQSGVPAAREPWSEGVAPAPEALTASAVWNKAPAGPCSPAHLFFPSSLRFGQILQRRLTCHKEDSHHYLPIMRRTPTSL